MATDCALFSLVRASIKRHYNLEIDALIEKHLTHQDIATTLVVAVAAPAVVAAPEAPAVVAAPVVSDKGNTGTHTYIIYYIYIYTVTKPTL